METYYTAVSIDLLKQIIAKKRLLLAPLGNDKNHGILTLTEDLDYWKEAITSQTDEPELEDYTYAAMLELHLTSGVVARLIQDPQVGRVSEEVQNIMQQAHKQPLPVVRPEESSVLVLSAIRRSDNGSGGDGLTQTYELKGKLTGDAVLARLNEALGKIIFVGGVKGIESKVPGL